jgi:hypothetical protein
MREQAEKFDKTTAAIGAVFAAAGFYFVLAALGIVPPPGDANGPLWLVLAAGFVFMFAGCAVILQWAGGASMQTGRMSASAPNWLIAVQLLLVAMVSASMAAIGSWIAFGPGERSFSSNVPFVETIGMGEIIGRAAFGLGAIIVWLFAIAMAVRGVRQLLGHGDRADTPQTRGH